MFAENVSYSKGFSLKFKKALFTSLTYVGADSIKVIRHLMR